MLKMHLLIGSRRSSTLKHTYIHTHISNVFTSPKRTIYIRPLSKKPCRSSSSTTDFRIRFPCQPHPIYTPARCQTWLGYIDIYVCMHIYVSMYDSPYQRNNNIYIFYKMSHHVAKILPVRSRQRPLI